MIYPEILTALSGHRINDIAGWEKHRRDEILYLFKNYVYGFNPVEKPDDISFSVQEIEREHNILQKKIFITVKGHRMESNLFLPKGNKEKLPVFVLCMHKLQVEKCLIDEELDYDRIPILDIIKRGYAVICMKATDIHSDFFEEGKLHQGGIFDVLDTNRQSNSWSIIGAWAWGMSRVVDYLETDDGIDTEKIIAVGHSRNGKTALWAAACDKRFAMSVSNNSGCTGAAFLRGKKGEHLDYINSITNWFCDNYRKYNDDEHMLPVDQHMLLSLIAPRLLYVSSASEDEWSDPDAELKSCILASEAYELYGKKGVVVNTPVENDTPYHEGSIGYHRKTGEHSIDKYDWNMFMDFADRHLNQIH